MKGSILIIDDNPNNLHLLEKLLIDEGYEVRISTSAKLALKSIEIKKPELILLDIMMPEMDGYEVCQKLKLNVETIKIPIIFLSAKAEAIDKIKAFEIGGIDYITKPFNEKEVLVRVNTHLSLYRMQNHLESEVELRTKELKESEEKFRHLVECIKDDYLFYTHGVDGVFTYVSPSIKNILGYSQDEFKTHYSKYLTNNHINEKAYELTKKAIKGEKQPAYELEIYHKDGTCRWLEISENPIFDDEKRVIRIEGIAHDITIRKKSEEKIKNFNIELEKRIKEEIAKRKEQEKVMLYQARQGVIGELMGNIAHQWRQPLNLISLIINNFEFLYEDNQLSKDEFKENLTIVNDTLEKLSKTIDNFSKFFKPSDEKENFKIKNIIDDALSLIDKIEEDNIKVNLNVEDIAFFGFKNAFSQVIFYIINNAKEAIKRNCINNCFLNINVKKEKENILIEVIDSGGGIKEDIIGKVFEPYFTTKFQSQGIGLGLYITKMLIEKYMSGKIFVQNLKGGVKFTIEIPLIQ